MEDEKWWDELVGYTFVAFDADLGIATFEGPSGGWRRVNCWTDGMMPDWTNTMTWDTAEQAQDVAIEWQTWFGEESMSYGELAEWQQFFERLAERFPELADEFRENGII